MSPATRQTPYEILLAEDNPADVTLVREALKNQGLSCTLHIVRDGAQAIAFVQDRDKVKGSPQLDLVLLDMHLPKYDGQEIMTRLRATEHCAQTPIIVMTSSVSPADYEAAEKHAAMHYFQKPSSLTQFMRLGRIVQDVLDKEISK
ncbi:MAG TPA: response regulator [Bryobacteraceae bacterium]|nr:response regulator [Bryobacteraceae bacterium]